MDSIQNKVASSGIISIDPADFYTPGERCVFDIKAHLFQELILKEKDFRAFVSSNDWSVYRDKFVGLVCTADAIVPTWAYMLVALALEPFAKRVFFADTDAMELLLYKEKMQLINPQDFKDARVVIKGCGDIPVPVNVYVELGRLLKPHVKSLMYGEPCSTVPLYKAKANKV
jgi:hypothetical protein